MCIRDRDGSREAQLLVDEMMEACDCEWRGLGVIPKSGMKLRQEWQEFDARLKYQMPKIEGKPNPACRCGDVLQGKCKPSDCKVFGKGCTPQHPIGACMVSGEGACSAYYPVSYTHLRAHETKANLVCRLLLEKKKKEHKKDRQ